MKAVRLLGVVLLVSSLLGTKALLSFDSDALLDEGNKNIDRFVSGKVDAGNLQDAIEASKTYALRHLALAEHAGRSTHETKAFESALLKSRDVSKASLNKINEFREKASQLSKAAVKAASTSENVIKAVINNGVHGKELKKLALGEATKPETVAKKTSGFMKKMGDLVGRVRDGFNQWRDRLTKSKKTEQPYVSLKDVGSESFGGLSKEDMAGEDEQDQQASDEDARAEDQRFLEKQRASNSLRQVSQKVGVDIKIKQLYEQMGQGKELYLGGLERSIKDLADSGQFNNDEVSKYKQDLDKFKKHNEPFEQKRVAAEEEKNRKLFEGLTEQAKQMDAASSVASKPAMPFAPSPGVAAESVGASEAAVNEGIQTVASSKSLENLGEQAKESAADYPPSQQSIVDHNKTANDLHQKLWDMENARQADPGTFEKTLNELKDSISKVSQPDLEKHITGHEAWLPHFKGQAVEHPLAAKEQDAESGQQTASSPPATGNSALLDSIRAGTSLRRVDSSQQRIRDDAGATMKNKPSGSSGGMGGVGQSADLLKALAWRRQGMGK